MVSTPSYREQHTRVKATETTHGSGVVGEVVGLLLGDSLVPKQIITDVRRLEPLPPIYSQIDPPWSYKIDSDGLWSSRASLCLNQDRQLYQVLRT